MRVAQRMHQWGKGDAQLEEQFIKFVDKVVRPLTPEERMERSKSIWRSGVKAFEDNARQGK